MRTQTHESLKEAERREPQQAETLQLEALLAALRGNWPAAEERFTALGERSPAEMQGAVQLWQHTFAARVSTSGATWDCLRNSKATCSRVSMHSYGGSDVSARDLYASGRWEQLIMLPLPAATDDSEWLWRGVALAETGNCTPAIPALERGPQTGAPEGKFWLDVGYAGEGERVLAKLGRLGYTMALHQLKGIRF